MFLLKNKYPKYYSFQGRKISKKISLPKKNLINKFYNDFSFDQDVIECLTDDKINRKINIPDRYDITNIEIGFGNGENLINSAKLINVNKLIYLGSSCIYPKNVKQPFVEDSLLKGELESSNQWYSLAKISAPRLLTCMCRGRRRG